MLGFQTWLGAVVAVLRASCARFSQTKGPLGSMGTGMPPSWGNYYSHEIPNIRGWFPTRGFRSQRQSRCVVNFVKLGSDEAARNPEPHTVQPCGSKVGPAKEAPPNFSQLLNPNRVRNFSFSGICITASRRSQAFRAALSPQASREAVCRRTDHVIGQRGFFFAFRDLFPSGRVTMASTVASSAAPPAFPGAEDFAVGLIGMGDMGKMYARRLSSAGWR